MFGEGKDRTNDGLLRIKTSNDPFILSLVGSLLEEAGIPYLLRDRGSGGYMKTILGFSKLGTDIYVTESDEDKAKEILKELEEKQE